MLKIRFYLIVIMVAMFFSSTWCFAGNEEKGSVAIHKMAKIMHRLKHFPSPQGKNELKALIKEKSTTYNERIIATAMINLQHGVRVNDAELLKKVLNDKKATSAEHEMVSIILGVSHRPSEQDKHRLEALMQ